LRLVRIKKRQKRVILAFYRALPAKSVMAHALLLGVHRKVYFDNTEGQLKDIGTNKGRYKSPATGAGEQ
jgi:hypothetical protein